MIPAVSSTSAASNSTAAAPRHPAEDALRSPELPVAAAQPAVAAAAAADADTVTISDQAAQQASAAPQQEPAEQVAEAAHAQQSPVKPDWVYQSADGNKDGKVTVFEQQVYDFRHYPSSLEKAEAYNKSAGESKPDAKLTA